VSGEQAFRVVAYRYAKASALALYAQQQRGL